MAQKEIYLGPISRKFRKLRIDPRQLVSLFKGGCYQIHETTELPRDTQLADIKIDADGTILMLIESDEFPVSTIEGFDTSDYQWAPTFLAITEMP